jgi:hypothetical protein
MTRIASERLLWRINQAAPNAPGIISGIARVPLTDEVIGEIKECLLSSEVSEVKWGISFASGILVLNPPREFLQWLLPMVPKWLTHADWEIRERGLEIFIRLRDNYKNYRELMLNMIKDPDASVRGLALRQNRTFLTKEDIPVLLEFQNDDYMTETEMGSPLIYALRNEALAAIEDLCGRQFRKSEKVKTVEGSLMVYWWDWQPVLEWWDKYKRKRFFWK